MSTKPAQIGDVVVGEFYMEVGGYYVFLPTGYKDGYWDEYMLTKLLLQLRKLNLEWDTQCITDPRIGG